MTRLTKSDNAIAISQQPATADNLLSRYFHAFAQIGTAQIFVLLSLALAAILAFYLFAGLKGNIGFVIELRLQKIWALLLVAATIAVSTLLFQTITANRILTPSIIGMDAFYLLCQTMLVFTYSGLGYSGIHLYGKFFIEVLLMLAVSLMIFMPLLTGAISLYRLLLIGIILGGLFRSLSGLLQRLIDPNDFAVLQYASYANFSQANSELLVICTVAALISFLLIWRWRHKLDVIALGKDVAVNLGIRWQPELLMILSVVCILVALSTALVGPVVFFGLLVVSLGHFVFRDARHQVMIPGCILIAMITLTGGQTLLERVIDSKTTLSVIVEFCGGLVFLMLILKDSRKS